MAVAVSGCASGMDGIGYYWQSVSGHLALMRASRPISQVLADTSAIPAVKGKLDYAQRARQFASTDLRLPDNGSYTSYADLKRSHVLWNVFATDALSLELRRWCFPVAGCIGYRGYYNKETALAYAKQLEVAGNDVHVGGVPAYSTLGWFDDPLPSTVIKYSEPQLARLIFHELAHQVVYVKGDSTFNESFATTVERVGVQRWLSKLEAAGADHSKRRDYDAANQRKADFVALLREARAELSSIYQSDQSNPAKLQQKALAFKKLQQRYQQMKARRWDGYSGYDAWFDRPLGNAHLAAIGAYNDLVPAFEAVLAASQPSLESRDRRKAGGDLAVFYERVKEISGMDKLRRRKALEQALEQARSNAVGTRTATQVVN